MAVPQTRRTVSYTKDNGDDVDIQVRYFDNVIVSPDVRFTAGGFGNQDKRCAITNNRRSLKPRKVVFKVTNNNGDEFYIDVICKTNDIAVDYINGGAVSIDATLNPTPVRYEGEQFTICIN